MNIRTDRRMKNFSAPRARQFVLVKRGGYKYQMIVLPSRCGARLDVESGMKDGHEVLPYEACQILGISWNHHGT